MLPTHHENNPCRVAYPYRNGCNKGEEGDEGAPLRIRSSQRELGAGLLTHTLHQQYNTVRTYRINIGGRRILIPPRLLALNGGAPSLVARPRCDQGNPHTTITTVVEGEGAYITKSSTAAVPATVSRRDIITFGSIKNTGIAGKVEVSEIVTTSETKNSQIG